MISRLTFSKQKRRCGRAAESKSGVYKLQGEKTQEAAASLRKILENCYCVTVEIREKEKENVAEINFVLPDRS